MKWCITADWHIRGDRPRCRTDIDWIEFQRGCIHEIFVLCLERQADLYVVGDIFHKPRIATEALCMLVEEFVWFQRQGGRAFILAGNHCLPYHVYALVSQSSFGVLRGVVPEIEVDPQIDAAPFGLDDPQGREFAFTHQLVFPDKASIPPGCDSQVASEVLERFKSRFVFTGDYHHAFLAEAEDSWEGQRRFLLNPGCINRQTVDMVDYIPKVAFFDLEAPSENAVEWVSLLSDRSMDLVSREHIEIQEERDARIEAFVQKIASSKGITLSFMDNLEAKLKTCAPGVQAIAHEVTQRAKEPQK